jgi:pimeloyl-ACP methyl ester carboxylesterase
MLIPIAAAILTLATLLVALLWRGWLALRRRPAPRFWRRTARWHVGLFAFHALATAPLALGVLAARFVGTRGDEASYTGPRVEADGTWQAQSRESLAAEHPPGSASEANEAAPTPAPFEVHLSSRDGVRLRGFLVPPREDRRGSDGEPRFTAVLVHGLYRSALEIEDPGRMLRDLGGEVLLLEMRNHGGSEHARPTFGLDESLDVLAAVDFLRSRPGASRRPLVLFAVSLGTAAAALAAPDIPGLGALILDAPMDSLRATGTRMIARFPASVPGLSGYWRHAILWSAEHLGRLPFDAVNPRESLARLSPHVPVLLIAAGHDWRMPPETVRALFESLPTDPERKELWIEPEATHGKVWVVAPEEYREHLARLVEAAVGSPDRAATDAEAEPGRGTAGEIADDAPR